MTVGNILPMSGYVPGHEKYFIQTSVENKEL